MIRQAQSFPLHFLVRSIRRSVYSCPNRFPRTTTNKTSRTDCFRFQTNLGHLFTCVIEALGTTTACNLSTTHGSVQSEQVLGQNSIPGPSYLFRMNSQSVVWCVPVHRYWCHIACRSAHRSWIWSLKSLIQTEERVHYCAHEWWSAASGVWFSN